MMITGLKIEFVDEPSYENAHNEADHDLPGQRDFWQLHRFSSDRERSVQLCGIWVKFSRYARLLINLREMKKLVFILMTIMALSLAALAQDKTIVLVRHAEKDSAANTMNGDDPLSAA